MKTILFSVLSLFTSLAFGQCDLTWTFQADEGGKKIATNERHLFGMSAKELAAHQKRGMRALDAVSKHQDKGGAYTLTLNETATCDGKPVGTPGVAVELRGLTLAAVNQFLRASASADNQFHNELDKRHKAKKKAWGD